MLTVRWRHRGEVWVRNLASTPLPAAVLPPFSGEAQAAAVVAAAHSLLTLQLAEPFALTLLNMGEQSTGLQFGVWGLTLPLNRLNCNYAGSNECGLL